MYKIHSFFYCTFGEFTHMYQKGMASAWVHKTRCQKDSKWNLEHRQEIVDPIPCLITCVRSYDINDNAGDIVR